MTLLTKIRTWNQFSHRERWLILRALILFPTVDLSLKLLGLQRTYTFLNYLLPQLTGDSARLLTTVHAVQIAAKYHTWATLLAVLPSVPEGKLVTSN